MKKFVLFSTLISLIIIAGAFYYLNKNGYKQTNLIANNIKYSPTIEVDEKLINAWGIAIRPKGAGGHFWVTGKDISFEYVGDVQNSPDPSLRKLHSDELKYVKLPVGSAENFATSTVFNGSDKSFVITQKIEGKKAITAPAKFIFASDGGIVSAWTEKKNKDGTFDRSNQAIKVIDESAKGSQFFGLAINSANNILYLADFGAKPAIKTYDAKFKPTKIVFDAPFDDNKNGKVDAGEYAPFNVQAITTPQGANNIFVAYAKTQTCPEEEISKGTCKKGELFVGEEDTSKAGYGKLAEFSENGKLIAVWKDKNSLSAPWGVVLAPNNFGKASNRLLVANFGSGTISTFNYETKEFVENLKDKGGKDIKIEKIWGLLFGNGESLGDSNALYFTAGPDDEKDGIFGVLRN